MLEDEEQLHLVELYGLMTALDQNIQDIRGDVLSRQESEVDLHGSLVRIVLKCYTEQFDELLMRDHGCIKDLDEVANVVVLGVHLHHDHLVLLGH